jgi:hypothetical protein
VLGLIAVFLLLGVLWIGYAFYRLEHGYHETRIIVGGPFVSQFPHLDPNAPTQKKEIESWFLKVIPPGTPGRQAREILRKSFTADLTTGRWVTIEEDACLAGGSFTKVKLHFNARGEFESVEVNQLASYL